MPPRAEAVYATLLMNDAYLPGVMVLGHSLKDKGARGKLIVLATLDNLSADTITELKTVYDDVVSVDRITNKTPANLYLMERADLVSTFTKIELWKLTQYRQIVYIDADAVALRAPNELLHLDTDFAAVPDIGWPDCFNSGVMVLRPNMGDYYSLLALAQRGISFDGADQGLLNMHFRDWERLSFAYNCTPSGNYQYVPAYRHFQSSINMVHYIGKDKPWTLGRENKHSSGVYGELLGRWWSVYDKHYRVPEAAYIAGQSRDDRKTVQDYVKGEQTASVYGYSSSQPVINVFPPPDPQTETTPQPLLEPSSGPSSGPISEPSYEPSSQSTSQPEQPRRFSAPHSEWDASRGPPPVNSKPEASNLPSEVYYMSEETKLFTPPSKYPDPPRDMYYQVPPKAAASPKPKPIFPWESHAPKATRVFPEEKPVSPERGPTPSVTDGSQPSQDSPPTPTITSDRDAWHAYRSNAWDDVPQIEQYVQSFAQNRRGHVQILHQAPAAPTDGSLQTPSGRRPSTKITDFPTEIERPSLPVTPAPVRRPSYWGEERDALGDLPAAEGVPKQEEWNPATKLVELQRRQSEVLERGPLSEPKELPQREMPGSADGAADTETSASKEPAVPFTEPSFGTTENSTGAGAVDDAAQEVTASA